MKACEFGGRLPVLVHCQPQYVDGTQSFAVMYGDLRKVMVQADDCIQKKFLNNQLFKKMETSITEHTYTHYAIQ